ncbi:MAG: trypsin-like serine protease [Deltaproteobacteria bacterium]|nr:trypsin-like serine protease [Deltaproteobacteria bacterium]
MSLLRASVRGVSFGMIAVALVLVTGASRSRADGSVRAIPIGSSALAGPDRFGLMFPWFGPLVEDGVPQAESDWPGTFRLDGMCTATAVGPRAILTAAHCVTDDYHGPITLNRDRFIATCRRHRDYGGREEQTRLADFGLCAWK